MQFDPGSTRKPPVKFAADTCRRCEILDDGRVKQNLDLGIKVDPYSHHGLSLNSTCWAEAARNTPQDGDLTEVSDINATPFLDVILVLLIIFMVAAPLSTVDAASSGNPALDQEAIAMIRRASPLPAPPEGTGASGAVALSVLIVFRR